MLHNRLAAILRLVLLTGVLSTLNPLYAAAATAPCLHVVVIDGLQVADLRSDPWRPLANSAALGLMNTRTAGHVNPAATHLTIGAQARADAPTNQSRVLDGAETVGLTPASALFTTLTGQEATAENVVVIDISRLIEANSPLADVIPGRLGRDLRTAGLTTAVVGNADTYDAKHRNAALLIMDERGLVPSGLVGSETLLTDVDWPYGWKTDYEALRKIGQDVSADVMVWELGDLARLDAYRQEMLGAAWNAQRQRALGETARFVQELLGTDPKAPLVVLAPTPGAEQQIAGYWLAPVLLWHALDPGLLYSTSTQTPGVMNNVDVGKAIFTLSTQDKPGPLLVQTQASPATTVTKAYQRYIALHDQRAPVLQAYVIFSIIAFFFSWVVMWATHQGRFSRQGLWPWLLLLVASFPLAALIQPPLNTSPGPVLAVGVLFAAILATASWWSGNHSIRAFLFLFAATSVALVADTLTGSHLIRNSVLGYDVISGARFYGIGNEYMGVLLTSTLMSVGILLDEWNSRLSLSIAVGAMVIAAVATGAPWWGANNGGAVAAIIGFSFTGRFLANKEVTWRWLLQLGLLLAVVFIGAASLDLWLRPAAPSHLGSLARSISQEGVDPLITVAQRKLAMNWKLLKYTIWTKALLMSLAVSLALLIRPPRRLRTLFRGMPHQMAVTKGALVTTVVALVANDSGVVAAATAMIPITTTLLYIATCAAQRTSNRPEGMSPRP